MSGLLRVSQEIIKVQGLLTIYDAPLDLPYRDPVEF